MATGLAKGRDLRGGKENIVAIIGDGSLSGGEAFEGLDNAAVLGSNIIVIVNDNDMSIAKNEGGLYGNLKLLRDTNGQAECNFFKALGFEYHYLDNGHDIKAMIDLFNKVKDTNHPVLIHLHTIKGKGLEVAELDKESYHWVLPGVLDKKDDSIISAKSEDYGSITANYIENKYNEDNTVIAISPATPAVTGFTPAFRDKAGIHYTDVGIAEEHAIAFASGIAKNGAKPILGVMSSFVQRTYDQLSQDLALNNNPATILVFWGSISGMDATHLTVFDIPLISNIPNIVYLAPTCKEEYLRMLDWSVEQQNKPTLMNPKFITGVDEDLMESLKAEHKVVITLEDGVLDGGFGEKIARYFGNSEMKVLNFGAKKEFTDRASVEELYTRYHLTPELIVEDIKTCL